MKNITIKCIRPLVYLRLVVLRYSVFLALTSEYVTGVLSSPKQQQQQQQKLIKKTVQGFVSQYGNKVLEKSM